MKGDEKTESVQPKPRLPGWTPVAAKYRQDGLVNAEFGGTAEEQVTKGRIVKTGGVVKYIAPAEFRSMIERDKNTALEIAKKEGLLQAQK